MPDAEEDSQPFKFYELPPDQFPFLVELLVPGTEEVIWSATVEGPGALQVPGLATLGVPKVWARVTYPDGAVCCRPEDLEQNA